MLSGLKIKYSLYIYYLFHLVIYSYSTAVKIWFRQAYRLVDPPCSGYWAGIHPIQSRPSTYHNRSPSDQSVTSAGTFSFLLLLSRGATMTQNGVRQSSQDGKTLLLCTGNIMTDGDRGGFLNTSMSKSNAEV
jgi:hypothetical protein